jgi:hypothetical protein
MPPQPKQSWTVPRRAINLMEALGAIGLYKTAKIAIETALADVGMDFVSDLAPPLV